MKSVLVLTLVYILFTNAVLAIETVDTAIVGGGIGGITALNELTAGGMSNVVLLEANPTRYGGRINTIFVPGYSKPIELGASFFHDSNYNPMIALGQEAGMTFEPMDFDANSAWKDGRFLNDNQRIKVYTGYLANLAGVDNYRQTCRSYAEAIRLSGYDFDDRGTETLLMTEEQVIGDNLEYFDSAAVDAPPGDLGSDYIVTSPGGYKQILEYLLDYPTSSRSKLRLGALVTKIDLTTPGNKVTITYTQGNIQKQIVANKVILTVPMGVLKKGSIQFVPPLPANYQHTIDLALFGNVNKGYLFYNPTSATAQKLANLPVNIFYKIAEGDNPRYNDQLTYFYNDMYIQGQPVIQSYYTGNYSRMTETLSDSQVLDLHRTALNFLVSSNSGSNNNNVNGPTPLPAPDLFIRTQWGEEPNIGGVYTDFGLCNILDDFLLLGTPIQDKLYFAGEHVLVEGPVPQTVTASIGCTYTAYLSAQHATSLILGN